MSHHGRQKLRPRHGNGASQDEVGCSSPARDEKAQLGGEGCLRGNEEIASECGTEAARVRRTGGQHPAGADPRPRGRVLEPEVKLKQARRRLQTLEQVDQPKHKGRVRLAAGRGRRPATRSSGSWIGCCVRSVARRDARKQSGPRRQRIRCGTINLRISRSQSASIRTGRSRSANCCCSSPTTEALMASGGIGARPRGSPSRHTRWRILVQPLHRGQAGVRPQAPDSHPIANKVLVDTASRQNQGRGGRSVSLPLAAWRAARRPSRRRGVNSGLGTVRIR
jgi:hypothetical protein